MHRRIAPLLPLVLILLLGCSKKSEDSSKKAEDDSTESEADFADAEEGTVGLTIGPAEPPSGNAAIRVDGFGQPGFDSPQTKLKIRVSGPKGTKAKIQATSFVTAGDDEPVTLELDLMHAYATSVPERGELSIDVFAKPKGKKAVKQAFVMLVGKTWAGADALRRLEPLPTDGVSKRRDDAMLYFRTDIAGLVQLIGTPKARILDIDFIATEQRKATDLGSCGSYTSKDGKTLGVSKRSLAVTVSIADRRKKKVIETKTFDSTTPQCPSSLSALKETSSLYVDGVVDDKAIAEWLATKVKPAKKS